ncbi:MAG: winged helix-turn-helix domain-containing protein, partial [Spirochaetales bacterium]
VHGIRIDVSRHEVFVEDEMVNLSATEFSILEFLSRHAGWVFSRNQIIDAVKGKDYPVTERSVDVQILGLRKKLGAKGVLIQTVRGVGYRLQAG